MADKNYKLTFEMSDGSTKEVIFTVPQGEAGKSAYEYAQKAGYMGTEEEFSRQLADVGAEEIVISSTEPTDENVKIWINPEEDDDVNGGAGINVTAEVGQIIRVKEVDANSRPTAWEAVDYPIAETEIIPQTTYTPTYDNTFGCYVRYGLSVDNCLIAGETYTVLFDGVEYTCIAETASLGSATGVYIGNGVIATGVDTGEPFALLTADGTVGISFFGFDGNEHTVSASVAKLRDRYTPQLALPYCIEVTGEGTDDDPYVCNDTVASVEAIYRSGRSIVVKRRTTLSTHVNVGSVLAAYTDNIFALNLAVAPAEGIAATSFSPYGLTFGFTNTLCLGGSTTAISGGMWFYPLEDGTYRVSQTLDD